MPTRQSRRTRRRVVAPSTLPRPVSEGAPVESVVVDEPEAVVHASPRTASRRLPVMRAHHVVTDYSYIRPDLLLTAAVSAVCVAFVVGMAFVLS